MNAALAALSAAALLAAAGNSRAQECSARVLAPVVDDLGNAWKPGQTLPVDIARGDSFCASGGSCVPQHNLGAEALRLSNCRLGASIGGGDRRLVADPRLGGAAFTRRFNRRAQAEARLSALGFSNAAAGSFADDFVNRPASATARLVARALAGSFPALAALRAQQP